LNTLNGSTRSINFDFLIHQVIAVSRGEFAGKIQFTEFPLLARVGAAGVPLLVVPTKLEEAPDATDPPVKVFVATHA
jgi:hypothetical protein